MKKNLLLTLFSLLVFCGSAWGECYIIEGQSGSSEQTYELSAGKPSELFFTVTAKKTGTIIKSVSGSVSAQQYVDDKWSDVENSTVTIYNSEGTTDKEHLTINPNATKIKVKVSKLSGSISFSNLRVTKTESLNIDKTSLDFGSSADATVKKELKFNVNYSATNNHDIIISKFPDKEQFTIEGYSETSKIVVGNTCNTGSKEITVKFETSEMGVYTDLIKLSYGDNEYPILLSGIKSPNIAAPTSFTVTTDDNSYTTLNASWEYSGTATGFAIKNDNNNSLQYFEGANLRAATITGLMPGTTYSFTIYPTVNSVPSINGTPSAAVTTKQSPCTNVETINNVHLGSSSWLSPGSWGHTSDPVNISTHAAIISFKYATITGLATRVGFHIEENINNQWVRNEWSSTGSEGSGSAELNHKTTQIRFVYDGNYGADFTEIKAIQGVYVEASAKDGGKAINFGDAVKLGQSIEKKIVVDWSVVACNIISSDTKNQFSLSKTQIGENGCKHGTEEITVTYTAKEIGSQYETLNINGVIIELSANCVWPAPTSINVNPSYTTADVSWTSVSGADSYLLSVKNGQNEKIYENITDNSFTVEGLSMNTEYVFSVKSVKGKTLSEATSITESTLVLAVPTLSATDIDYRSATLTWNEIADAGSYRIVCEEIGKDTLINKGYNTLDVNGLALHTEYTFKIISRLPDGTESPLGYNSVEFTTNDLAAPQNFKAEEVSYTSIPTVWDAVEDATGYRVRNETLYTYEDVSNETTAYLFAALEENTNYTISVTPIYNGELSNNKASLNVTTQKMPIVPTSDCEQFRDVKERSMEAFIIGKNTVYNFGKAVYKSNVSFKAKASTAALLNTDLYAQVDGQWQKIWDESDAGISSSYKTFTAEIPDGATAVRFYNEAGSSMWRNYSELIVKRRNELNPNTDLLQFGNVVLGQTETRSITVQYSNLADFTILSEGSSEFKVEMPETKACEYGSVECKISYTPVTLDKIHQGSVTLRNGISKSIALEGGVSKLPASPFVAASTGKSAIIVSWSKVISATSYKLDCPEAGIEGVDIKDTGEETYSYNITNLEENKEYTSTLTTMYGDIENESLTKTVRTYSTVNVEAGGKAQETTSWTLTGEDGMWNKDEKSFKYGSQVTITPKNSDNCYVYEKTVIGSETTTENPAVFTISEPVTATIYYTDKELTAPTLNVICNSKNKAELSWNANECAETYTIYVNSDGDVRVIPNITSTNYTIGEMTPATDYTFKVKAVRGDLNATSDEVSVTTYGTVDIQAGGVAPETTSWTLTGEVGKWNEIENSFEIGSTVTILASNFDASAVFDKMQYYDGESTINPTAITMLNASVSKTWANVFFKYSGVAKTDDGHEFATLSEAIEYSKTHNVEITLLTDCPTENIDLEAGSNVVLDGNGFRVGDVTVRSGAKLTTNGALIMGNLNIKTEYRNSGEVDPNGQDLDVIGTVSFDKILDPSGVIDNSVWYGVCVPFPVDIKDVKGVLNNGDEVPLAYGVNVLFDRYDGDMRAAKGKGWVKMTASETLVPGKMYILLSDYNTVRFYKKDGTPIVSDVTTIQLQDFVAPKIEDQGWNAIGNSQIFHVGMSSETVFGQTLVQGTKAYDLVSLDNENFVVASPVFIQYTDGDKNVELFKKQSASLRSVEAENDMFNLRIAKEGQENAADQMFITASEFASDMYVIGNDLAKMGDLTGVNMARIWMNAKNTKLCVIDAKLSDDVAEIPLGIYVPKSGNYKLYLNSIAEGLTLELLYNGEIIHNFADGEFTTAIAKGTNNGYSLKISANADAPVITDVDGVEDIKAYIKENTLYITGLNDGAEYTVYDLHNKIADRIANGGTEQVDLPLQGVYFVISGETTIKLLNK